MGIGYSIVKYISKTLTTLYFRKIYVIGQENIPNSGPIIICGNHSNQFIDAMMIMSYSHRALSFLMAAVSFNKRIIGDAAKVLNAIPVMRPEDYKVKGKGKVKFISSKEIMGYETNFIEGSKSFKGFGILINSKLFIVEKVADNTTLFIKENIEESQLLTAEYEFFFVPKIDNSTLFKAVYDRFKENGCICIFPEGTSHDRTDFLKLKSGIAMMALGAMSEHITENIKIVPVGLNYFNRHEFRSEVIVEFGRPFEVPREWAEEFKINKKDSAEKLLKEIEFRMKAVTFTAPSYLELRSIFFIRKLYIPVDTKLSPAQFSELCKRFNKGYEKLKDREEIKPCMKKVQNYMEELDFLGLTDGQVKKMDFTYTWLLRHTIISIFTFTLSLIISLPGILIFVPAGIFIRNKAEKERIAAKKKNPNKIEGLDVVSSAKVTYFVMFLPILLIIWNMMALFLNNKLLEGYFCWFTVIVFSVIIFPVYIYSNLYLNKAFIKAYDYISQNTQVLYSRFLYFLFPKKVRNLTKAREILSKEVLEFTDKFIEDVDPKYKEFRILYSNPVSNETEYLIRKNSLRKIRRESTVEMKGLLDSIS